MAQPDILVTLGLLDFRSLPRWGQKNRYQENSGLNVFDSQVFLQNKTTVLTDSRLVELSQVRPIDNLFTILREMVRYPGQNDMVRQDMNALVEKYSVKEVCSMLIQILIDRDATYLVSRRVEGMFKDRQLVMRDIRGNSAQGYRTGH